MSEATTNADEGLAEEAVADSFGHVDGALGARIDDVIGGDSAINDVTRYFSERPNDRFTGARFERLSGGGDATHVSNVVTADDVVALSFLSIRVSGMVALKLLVDREGDISRLLAQIPTDVPLWHADRTLLAGPAADLWDLIYRLDEGDDRGRRWVIAGKLMARKRPELIPIWDSVVRGVVGLEKGASWWLSLQAALQNADRRQRIEELRAQAGLNTKVSILRTLDVALWMHGKRAPTVGLNDSGVATRRRPGPLA